MKCQWEAALIIDEYVRFKAREMNGTVLDGGHKPTREAWERAYLKSVCQDLLACLEEGQKVLTVDFYLEMYQKRMNKAQEVAA
jgi:hypothetical protein